MLYGLYIGEPIRFILYETLSALDFDRNPPKLVEFLSYGFSYQTVLIGPFYFYKDHLEFINGQNITKHQVSVPKQFDSTIML